jgi:hypothetical protein
VRQDRADLDHPGRRVLTLPDARPGPSRETDACFIVRSANKDKNTQREFVDHVLHIEKVLRSKKDVYLFTIFFSNVDLATRSLAGTDERSCQPLIK